MRCSEPQETVPIISRAVKVPVGTPALEKRVELLRTKSELGNQPGTMSRQPCKEPVDGGSCLRRKIEFLLERETGAFSRGQKTIVRVESAGPVDRAHAELVEHEQRSTNCDQSDRLVEKPVAVDVLRRLLEEEHAVRLGTREALEGGNPGSEIRTEPGHCQRNLVLVGGDSLRVVPEATESRERPPQTHPYVQDAGRSRRQPRKNEIGRSLLRREERLTRILE
jgi:hypothetical protein